MSKMVIVNKQTGESILINKDEEFEIRSNWQGKHMARFHFNDEGICDSMPQEYAQNEEGPTKTKIEEGFISLPNDRYTRVPQQVCPEFSKSTYASLWLKLISHLDFFTNAVYTKWLPNGRRIYAHSKEDLMEVTSSTKTQFYGFYKDMFRKNYVSEWNSKEIGRVYVLNPKYAVNGFKIVDNVYFLFNPNEIPRDNTNKDELT